MRLRSRRFLSCVLLAAYAGISLLGEGLHSLMPEAGHHHHGIYVADCAGHDHGHANCHCHKEVAVLAVSDSSNADAHICEVCAFLFQAVSQPAEAAAPIDWQPLAVTSHCQLHSIYSLASLGPQAPRGPPLLA